MDKVSKFIVRYRNWILLAATLLLIPSVFGYLNTRVNYDILSYLPADSPSIQAQDVLADDFNLAGTAMVILDDQPDKSAASIKDQIDEIDGVDRTLWRTDVADLSIPSSMLPDALHDALYSEGSTMILVTFTEPAASDSTMKAITDIQQLVQGKGHVAGFSAITADTKAMVDRETPIYSGIAVLLCLVVLCLGLRSWLAPFIFLLGMAYPIIYNMGTNYFLGQISYVTSALSMILLLAVSMDYSIFLLHRYQEEKGKHEDKEEAMAKAIHATWISITSSSVTTIAGFLALLVMQLTLGKDIGIVMAKGVMLAVMSTILILPSLLMFFDKWIEKWTHPILIRPFPKAAAWVVDHSKTVLIVFALLIVPAVYCQSHTAQYYDLTQSLPADLDSVQGTTELKDKFDMNTSHFLMVDENLSGSKMNSMIKDIENVDGITDVIAYDKFVGPMIPSFMEPKAIQDILQQGGRKLVLINTEYRTATDEINAQLDALDEIVRQYDDSALIAGEGAMSEDLIKVTDVDFRMVNIVSVALIFVIIALTFKSLLLPVILVLCIEFAISVSMGLPFIFHKTVPFITGMVIGTIQLGACIDYAILLTSRFREELTGGLDARQAAVAALTRTSPSIMTSSLCFFAACSGVSMIAKMDLIQSMCTLLGCGALISAITIMTVLPCLLMYLNPWIARVTKNWPNPAKHQDQQDSKKTGEHHPSSLSHQQPVLHTNS